VKRHRDVKGLYEDIDMS